MLRVCPTVAEAQQWQRPNSGRDTHTMTITCSVSADRVESIFISGQLKVIPLSHYKLDNSFPSTARMPFMSPPNIFIIVVIFYYNELWCYLFKIIYCLVRVLEQYCTVAFAEEVNCLLSFAFSVWGLYVYKTLSDHVLVLCGLYFLYHIRNE